MSGAEALQAQGLDVLLVDGKLVPASGGGTFETINPATEEVLGVAADGTAADMDAAIGAARRAFDESGWSVDVELRVRCIRQLRDALQAHGEEMRALTTAEVGAPAFLTTGPQYDTPVGDLTFAADTAERYDWRTDMGTSEVMGITSRRFVLREAAGVVGAVTPWNFPHQINLAKVGPALAAGNTVVLKPAPDTPWAASALARIAATETDLPPGVLNVVTSSDHMVGAQLSSDPRVDLVSFTGSTATGRKVMAAGSETLKKVFLELGGKSAFIVLDDADMAAAASMAAFGVCTHAGQGCAITTRVLLPRARFDEGVDVIVSTMAALAPGDPTDPGTICGPVISAVQRQRIEGYLASATADGGSFACGGGRPADRDTGFFIEPTLVVGLGNDARIAREEVFGPVLVAIPHDGDDDAVRIANDSEYGLSGSVFGGDRDRAWSVAGRLRAGTVAVNGGIWYGGDVPFGGYKQSGIGREMGLLGFEEYLEAKTVAEPA